MLVLLDYTFFVFHTVLILFNMFGWIWRRTRVAQLVTLGLTTFSWFVLGAYYGWGYCLCTDWHFQVRRELGYVDPEFTYVQLLVGRLTGVSLTLETANWLAAGVFVYIVAATALVWLWPRRRSVAPTAG